VTKYSFANLDKWADKSERRMDYVVRQATNDLLRGINIAPGINRGGSRKKGTIPRDLGPLAASLQSTLLGTSALSGPTGENSYVGVIGRMKAGDKARFAWGGAVAPYAPDVHYGANGVMGTFWIPEAAKKWNSYVRGAVAKGRAVVP